MYLTAAEYEEITGRSPAEATDARIKMSSQLLDSRIGNYGHGLSGWKLDLSILPENQQAAVKQWVAQMVVFLTDNGDTAPSASSVSLGRFSVTEHGQKGRVLPESLAFSDSILVSSGVVRRGVKIF